MFPKFSDRAQRLALESFRGYGNWTKFTAETRSLLIEVFFKVSEQLNSVLLILWSWTIFATEIYSHANNVFQSYRSAEQISLESFKRNSSLDWSKNWNSSDLSVPIVANWRHQQEANKLLNRIQITLNRTQSTAEAETAFCVREVGKQILRFIPN